MRFKIHNRENPKYESLGLSYQYLEQFYSEAQEKALDIILELIKVEKVTRIDYLKSRINQIKNKRKQDLQKEIGELL